jgi:RNA-dependent RNA polymerase
LKYLKEKAKIFVSNGAHLMGCVDEYGVLKGQFNDCHTQEDSLPEIFVKIDTERNGTYQVVEGLCLVVRNPSLHPGDVRIVKAINKPELQHMKNVVVFPQTGDRDIPGMCSGGDVDGDDYLVIWDKALLPKEWNLEPMNFTIEKPTPLDRDVTVQDITSFFIQYMKNDNLPVIASAHLCWADQEQTGVKSQKCKDALTQIGHAANISIGMRLASLHSHAVDYPKNGIPAIMERDLHPIRWPHFMERKAKGQYHSRKILGRLYDMIEREDFRPEIASPFDRRILSAYRLEEDMLEKARELKRDYDGAVKRIMAHYAIQTEFEVWSSFVMSHNMERKDYNLSEDLGLLSSTINSKFRELCVKAAGGREFENLGPFVAAMYTVTHQEFKEALPNIERPEDSPCQNTNFQADRIPLISFPWMFHHELGQIAAGLSSNRHSNILPMNKENPDYSAIGNKEYPPPSPKLNQ